VGDYVESAVLGCSGAVGCEDGGCVCCCVDRYCFDLVLMGFGRWLVCLSVDENVVSSLALS
jgi:hypothetical protein